MSNREVRITVRGAFDGLRPEQRAELLERAAEHDLMHAAFTAQGRLTYDLAARPFFTFRFADAVAGPADIPAAVARAETAAAAWLDERGYGYRNLASQATDMSEAPLGARGRAAARKGD